MAAAPTTQPTLGSTASRAKPRCSAFTALCMTCNSRRQKIWHCRVLIDELHQQLGSTASRARPRCSALTTRCMTCEVRIDGIRMC